jgi:hypothetical protein
VQKLKRLPWYKLARLFEGGSKVEQDDWSSLVVERQMAAPRLDDQQFREWMTDRPIFVSSVMDEEMNPTREAIRKWLHHWDAEPVMWEELAPQDRDSEAAYLDGVERSRLFLLFLGQAYGTTDNTGYSPTHKESNRGRDLHITRLLFQPEGIKSNSRYGPFNEWISALYSDISGARYKSPEDAAAQVERVIRQLASEDETVWMKIGNVVFPGTFKRRNAGGRLTFSISARLRNQNVIRALGDIARGRSQIRNVRLIAGLSSYPIQVTNMESEASHNSQEDVQIVCEANPHDRGGWTVLGNVNISDGSRMLTAVDQVQIWAQQAVFSDEIERSDRRFEMIFAAQHGPSLKTVLRTQNASGWLAQGLTRLYIIENLSTRFMGNLEILEVSTSTSHGLRVNATYIPDDYSRTTANFSGTVTLDR